MKIPTKDGECEVDPTWIRDWCELYVAEDVTIALHKARLWCLANPQKQKTKRGLRRFLNNTFIQNCRIKVIVRQAPIVHEERPEVSLETRRSYLTEMKQLTGVSK